MNLRSLSIEKTAKVKKARDRIQQRFSAPVKKAISPLSVRGRWLLVLPSMVEENIHIVRAGGNTREQRKGRRKKPMETYRTPNRFGGSIKWNLSTLSLGGRGGRLLKASRGKKEERAVKGKGGRGR